MTSVAMEKGSLSVLCVKAVKQTGKQRSCGIKARTHNRTRQDLKTAGGKSKSLTHILNMDKTWGVVVIHQNILEESGPNQAQEGSKGVRR